MATPLLLNPGGQSLFQLSKTWWLTGQPLTRSLQPVGIFRLIQGVFPMPIPFLFPGHDAETAMDAAACIGCGACVAACKNASAMLFVAAKVSQFAVLPQGKLEAKERVLKMVAKMDELGFGNCTNTGACEAECPKLISISHIARLNREYLSAKLT